MKQRPEAKEQAQQKSLSGKNQSKKSSSGAPDVHKLGGQRGIQQGGGQRRGKSA